MAGNTITLSMGPQHPSTHGVLRVELEMDGDVAAAGFCDIGYLHRGVEKLAEARTYHQVIPLTDRTDYLAATANNMAYCHAVEKFMGVEIPRRAQVLRTILLELNRVASHLVWWGTYGIDLGAMTPVLIAFRDRERVLQIFDNAFGARMTHNYLRIGGVAYDVHDTFISEIRNFITEFPARLREYDLLLSGNSIFQDRVRGVGVISREMAINFNLTGPNARASGVEYDLRRAAPYAIYPELDFNIPFATAGDCHARYVVRFEEMAESCKILDQCLKILESLPPEKSFTHAEWLEDTLPTEATSARAKMAKIIKPNKGEGYSAIEGPRGESGCFILHDGKKEPYRVKIKAPSFCNLQVVDFLCKGCTIPDIVAILGSIDIVLGDVDR